MVKCAKRRCNSGARSFRPDRSTSTLARTRASSGRARRPTRPRWTGARLHAVKRKASAAEDRRVKPRGGPANPARAELRDIIHARKAKIDVANRKQAAKDKRPANSYIYQAAGGTKSSRPKAARAEGKRAKKADSPPMMKTPAPRRKAQARVGVVA